MANKLDRLRDEMQSYITQDKDEQVDRKIDKLAVKDVVEKKFSRYVFNQPNFVKDYYENVGLLFGYGVRHASTKLKAVASRHKQEIRIAQLAGAMAMPAQFIAAPVATSVGIAMYSMLSYEPVESKIIEGLVRTLDVLGVDQYNREALAKFATESFKIGTSAVAPKAGAAVVRQAVSSGKSAFERGLGFFKDHVSNKPKLNQFENFKPGAGSSSVVSAESYSRFNHAAKEQSRIETLKMCEAELKGVIPDVQYNKLTKTIKKASGKAKADGVDTATFNVKLEKETGNIHLEAIRPGYDGYQKMSHNIAMSGERIRVVQTAFDRYGNIVSQNPGASKNNLFDVKW